MRSHCFVVMTRFWAAWEIVGPGATRPVAPFAENIKSYDETGVGTMQSATIFEHDCGLETGSMFRHARSHALFACASALAFELVALSPAASAVPANSPVGTWSTANGHGVVAIAQCGDALCGRIVGIDRAPTEPMPTDVHGQSQCGLPIITGEKPAADGTWLGQITDPRDGNTYQAKLWLDGSGDLHLRGFIGIPVLGSTQIWHKYTGPLTAECGLG